MISKKVFPEVNAIFVNRMHSGNISVAPMPMHRSADFESVDGCSKVQYIKYNETASISDYNILPPIQSKMSDLYQWVIDGKLFKMLMDKKLNGR